MRRATLLALLGSDLGLVPAERMVQALTAYNELGTQESFSAWLVHTGVLSAQKAIDLQSAFLHSRFRCLRCNTISAGNELADDFDVSCPSCGATALKRVVERQTDSRPATSSSPVHATSERLPALVLPSIPETPTLIGNWQIKGLIGAGTMGRVYRGYNPVIDQYVAIKVLDVLESNHPNVERFRHEARIQARLNHPNIVRVRDYGETEGKAYLVMDWIDGESLAVRLERLGPFSVQQVLRTALECAEGLEAAHKIGVIHRDLKPDNILLDVPSNTVKLTDFGLAKFGTTRLTNPGWMVGTPIYMSPEQIRDEKITPATDVYALGSVLFHLLTGVEPFQATTLPGLLQMHLNDPFPSARKFVADMPPALDDLLQKMGAKNPAERLQSMSEVRDAVRQIARRTLTRISSTTIERVMPSAAVNAPGNDEGLDSPTEFAGVPPSTDIEVVHLVGKLDTTRGAGLHAEVAQGFENDVIRFVIDLHGCQFADSTGIGFLVRVQDEVVRRGGMLLLAAVPESILLLFNMMGMKNFFQYAATVDEAVKTLGGGNSERRVRVQ